MPINNSLIIDIDGTLANVDHRVKFVRQEPKDWKSFHGGLSDDSVHHWCQEIIESFVARNYEILLLTGRGEEYREETISWLKENQITFHKLFMRARADRREDEIVKKEIYQKEISAHHNVLFVIEDRKKVVKMWRELGLICLQCDWGDF